MKKNLLVSFMVLTAACLSFISCADKIEEAMNTENTTMQEGSSPKKSSSSSGTKKNSDKKNEPTYSVYKLTTNVSDYNYYMSTDLSVGYYKSRFDLTLSQAQTRKDYFDNFEAVMLTKSEINSFLSGVKDSAINSFLNADNAWLAYAKSSNDVRVLLKMKDSSNVSLEAESKEDGKITLTWESNGYNDPYVYIWLDGAYNKIVSTSSKSSELTELSSGSHTVVLKDGSSSSSSEISATVVVTVSNGSKIIVTDYTVKNTEPYDYTYLDYKNISKASPAKYKVYLTEGNIYKLITASQGLNKNYIIDKYGDVSYGAYYPYVSVASEDGYTKYIYTTPISTVQETKEDSYGDLFIRPSESGYYIITIDIGYNYDSSYNKAVGFYLYSYLESCDSDYTVTSESPANGSDFSYAFLKADSSKDFNAELYKDDIYCVMITNQQRNSNYFTSKFGSTTYAAYNTYISASDPSGNDVKLYTSQTGTAYETRTYSYQTLYVRPSESGNYTFKISNTNNGITGFYLYKCFDAKVTTYTLSAAFDPYTSKVNFTISSSSRISEKAYITYTKSGSTSSGSYGTDISQETSFSTNGNADSSSETTYLYCIKNGSTKKEISNYASVTIPKLSEIYTLYDSNNLRNSYPGLTLKSDNSYDSTSTLADLYRKPLTIGYYASSSSSYYNSDSFTLLKSATSEKTTDYDALQGTLYAYYARNENGQRISNYTVGAVPDGIYTALTSTPTFISDYQIVDLKSTGYKIYKTTLTSGTYYLKVADSYNNSSLLTDYSDTIRAKVYLYNPQGECKFYYNGGSLSYSNLEVKEEGEYFIVCAPYNSSESGTCAFALYKN